jgi:hypothetical protein
VDPLPFAEMCNAENKHTANLLVAPGIWEHRQTEIMPEDLSFESADTQAFSNCPLLHNWAIHNQAGRNEDSSVVWFFEF